MRGSCSCEKEVWSWIWILGMGVMLKMSLGRVEHGTDELDTAS